MAVGEPHPFRHAVRQPPIFLGGYEFNPPCEPMQWVDQTGRWSHVLLPGTPPSLIRRWWTRFNKRTSRPSGKGFVVDERNDRMNEHSEDQCVVDLMPGIVTVSDWTMAGNGQRYACFWCAHWLVVPDKKMPIEGFKSSEKWTLFALVNGVAAATIPGCQVKAWVRSTSPPAYRPGNTDCFSIE